MLKCVLLVVIVLLVEVRNLHCCGTPEDTPRAAACRLESFALLLEQLPEKASEVGVDLAACVDNLLLELSSPGLFTFRRLESDSP